MHQQAADWASALALAWHTSAYNNTDRPTPHATDPQPNQSQGATVLYRAADLKELCDMCDMGDRNSTHPYSHAELSNTSP